jgi:hypothetical protein
VKRLNLSAAARFLGVSKSKMHRLAEAEGLSYLTDPMDKRPKFFSVEDLERLKHKSLKAKGED